MPGISLSLALGTGYVGGGAVAPVIAITTPTAGAIADVATSFTISGTCTNGTTAIRVKYGGVDISSDKGNQPVITGATWTWKWSPGLLRAGTANLTAEGEIGAGPTGTSAAVSMSVSNIPLRSIAHTVLHADDLALADGAQVTTWTARVGVSGTGNAGTTYKVGAIDAKAYGLKNAVRFTAASSGKVDVDAMASLFTGNQTPIFIYFFGQTLGATGSRVFFSAGTGAGNGTAQKWLLWQTIGAPSVMRLQKAATNSTFTSGSSYNGDTGLHMYGGEDTGTQVSVFRDAEARMKANASNPQANTGTAGGASLINKATIGAYCSNGTFTNIFDGYCRGFFATTTQPTQAQRDYLLNFFAGNYDNDQYYGDDTIAWNGIVFDGQSNTESIATADVTDVADPTIRMWNRSIINHPNDPATHAALGPVGGCIGAWYFGPKEAKALSGVNTHVFVYGKGATGINSFNTETDDDYFSVQLWDELCRHLQQFLCAMGGAPNTLEVNRNQGETDAQSSPGGTTFGANLTTRFSKFKTRFGAATKFRQLKINTNFTGLGFVSDVNTGINTAVAGEAHAVSIDPSDLSGSANIDGTGIHYKRGSSNAEGQWALGHRFAITSVP